MGSLGWADCGDGDRSFSPCTYAFKQPASECAPCGPCTRHAQELASGLGSGNIVQVECIEVGQAQREAGQGRAPEGFEQKGSPP